MTRARDIADQQDNLGGAVAPFVAGKNACINGGFDFWQRGTSIAFTGSGYQYMSDRWRFVRGNFTTGATVSRQATADTTNLPNIQYCARIQRDSGNTSTQYLEYATTFETANSLQFAGKTITFSFYARKGANYSEATSNLTVLGVYGTGVDQSQENFTGRVQFIGTSVTLTTAWQRFFFTGNVPSNATELAILTAFTPTGTAGANDYFEITGVQYELGVQMTPFARAGGSIGGELALCQRYFAVVNGYSVGGYASGSGQSIIVPLSLPTTMRIQATVTFTNTGTTANFSSIQTISTSTTQAGIQLVAAGAGFSGSYGNSTQLTASAEL